MTREEWLKRAVRKLRPLLRKAGIQMRPRWQVSMSLASSRKAIGQCFLGTYPHDAMVLTTGSKKGTKGGYWPVYVSPADERYRVQISERALKEYGPPVCPITGEQMTLATGRAPKWPTN